MDKIVLGKRNLNIPEEAFYEGQEFLRLCEAGVIILMAEACKDFALYSIAEMLRTVATILLTEFSLIPFKFSPPCIRDDPAELFRDGQSKIILWLKNKMKDLKVEAELNGDIASSYIFNKTITYEDYTVVDLELYEDIKNELKTEWWKTGHE